MWSSILELARALSLSLSLYKRGRYLSQRDSYL
jgi:hypothetical protein